MHRKSIRTWIVLLMAIILTLTACQVAQPPSPKSPINLSVWIYYNGDQLSAFQSLVQEFNDTVGKDKNIHIDVMNLGSVDDLKDAVMNSANGKVGAEPLPNIFAAYADTAYSLDRMELVADLSPYLSEEERSAFIDGYLEEGTLGGGSTIKIFPIAKSVELLLLNETDFAPFAKAKGVTHEDLKTFEGITRVSKLYYEWTDSQTPEPHDGKAFFGRDAMANYFFIGAKQLGLNIIEVDGDDVTFSFNKKTARKLWDNYYVPFIKGYFDASGRYRSDDIKTGNILALVGSSSGATYFPTQVASADGSFHDIEMSVLPCPQFEGGAPVAVQQGAGLVVTKQSEEAIDASVTFLKWFSQPSVNIRFSVESAYLPVMEEANDLAKIKELFGGEMDPRTEDILTESLKTVKENTLYTPQAFENGDLFRNILEYSMFDLAVQDAQNVREKMTTGLSLEDACASYLTDQYFNQWYEKTYNELIQLVQ